jgi:hypothetical protein
MREKMILKHNILWTTGCGDKVDVSARVEDEVVNVWIVDVLLKDVIFLLVVDVKGMRDVDL